MSFFFKEIARASVQAMWSSPLDTFVCGLIYLRALRCLLWAACRSRNALLLLLGAGLCTRCNLGVCCRLHMPTSKSQHCCDLDRLPGEELSSDMNESTDPFWLLVRTTSALYADGRHGLHSAENWDSKRSVLIPFPNTRKKMEYLYPAESNMSTGYELFLSRFLSLVSSPSRAIQ